MTTRLAPLLSLSALSLAAHAARAAPLEFVPDQAAFKQRVITASYQHPVMIEFGAWWCDACKKLEPVLEQLGEQSPGSLSVVQAEVDALPATARKYHVEAIPVLLFFSRGEVIGRLSGEHTLEETRRYFLKLTATRPLSEAP